MPCIWCKSVRHNARDVSREALIAILIKKRKRNRVRAVCRDGPIPLFRVSTATASGVEKHYPIPAIGSSMQGVLSVVFIGKDIVGHAVNFEGAGKEVRWQLSRGTEWNVPVFDSVRITA